MEEAILGVVSTINSYLSNYILIILLLGMGIWFTIRTKFIQFRCFGEGWRRLFGDFSLRGGNQGGAMTSFQALSTAVAAQVGTGNIVGACGAIIVGGPGAIFWMWIIALLGMATNYAEAVMAQKTRVVDADGTVHGGPVYYTTDLGENWEINEDLPSYTYPLTLVADDNYIYTAIYSPLLDDANSGVWRISKAELGVSGINAATAENGVRIEGGYIRTSGNADRIDVYSIAGENVLGASGTDCLSTSSLAPGMYVYRVISGTESFSGKFVNNPSRQ